MTLLCLAMWYIIDAIPYSPNGGCVTLKSRFLDVHILKKLTVQVEYVDVPFLPDISSNCSGNRSTFIMAGSHAAQR